MRKLSSILFQNVFLERGLYTERSEDQKITSEIGVFCCCARLFVYVLNWIELEILQYYDTAARKEIEFNARIIYICYPSNNHMLYGIDLLYMWKNSALIRLKKKQKIQF
jgi:hypothetical protein